MRPGSAVAVGKLLTVVVAHGLAEPARCHLVLSCLFASGFQWFFVVKRRFKVFAIILHGFHAVVFIRLDNGRFLFPGWRGTL